MNIIEEEESLNSTEEGEKKENEKITNTPKVVTEKFKRPPAFHSSGNFSKGNFQNNRQRPGRAASRGR